MNPSRPYVAVRPLLTLISRYLAASGHLGARSYAASSQGHPQPRPRARSSAAVGSPLARAEGEVRHIDFTKEFKGRDDSSFPCLTRYSKQKHYSAVLLHVTQRAEGHSLIGGGSDWVQEDGSESIEMLLSPPAG